MISHVLSFYVAIYNEYGAIDENVHNIWYSIWYAYNTKHDIVQKP